MTPSRAMNLLVYSGLELLGDGVMKLPFLGAVRRRWPEARITWLAGKGKTVYAHDLSPLVAPLLDEIIEDAGIGSRARELLRRPLPGRRFDLVIDTQRRVLTSLILRRIRTPPASSPARRASCSRTSARPAPISGRPGSSTSCSISSPSPAASASSPLSASPSARPGARRRHWPCRRGRSMSASPPAPAAPTSAGRATASSRWPKRSSAPGVRAVLLLGPDERDWAGELAAALPGALLPLQDGRIAPDVAASPLYTLAVARRLAVAVANDSGTGHLLAAAGAPLVSLFGPSAAAKFAPAARRLILVEAQRFGGDDMALIPLDAVSEAVERAGSGVLAAQRLAGTVRALAPRINPARRPPATTRVALRRRGITRAAGSSTVTVVPAPGALAMVSVPPCISTSCLAIGRPRPVPSYLRCSPLLTWRNGVSAIGISSAVMPMP